MTGGDVLHDRRLDDPPRLVGVCHHLIRGHRNNRAPVPLDPDQPDHRQRAQGLAYPGPSGTEPLSKQLFGQPLAGTETALADFGGQ